MVVAALFYSFLMFEIFFILSEIFIGLGDHRANVRIVAFVRFDPRVPRRVQDLV